MAVEKLFAIKDAIDVKITPNGSEDVLMTIDYLNDCALSKEGETTYAKKKGANAIAFSAPPTGTLTMNSELATLNWLGLALGGTVTGEKISVTSVSPSTSYKIEGTFRCVNTDGTETVRTISFPNAKPQPKCELNFSTENVASFSLVFDLMVDAKGNLMEFNIPSGVPGVGASVASETEAKTSLGDKKAK